MKGCLVLLWSTIKLISCEKKQACRLCHRSEDYDNCEYFVYPHEYAKYENKIFKTGGCRRHQMHLSCFVRRINHQSMRTMNNPGFIQCPVCEQDVSTALASALRKVFYNLVYADKGAEIKNMQSWLSVVNEYPKMVGYVSNGLTLSFSEFSKIIKFICECYPVDGCEIERTIFMDLVQNLLSSTDVAEDNLEQWIPMNNANSYSLNDLFAFFTKHHNQMENFIQISLCELGANILYKQANYDGSLEKIIISHLERLQKGPVKPVYYLLLREKMITILARHEQNTLSTMICESTINEFDASGVLNKMFQCVLCNSTRSSPESDTKIPIPENESPYEIIMLIPEIITILEESESNITRCRSFKKLLHAKILEILLNYYPMIQESINPCELLYVYTKDGWYNVIYKKHTSFMGLKRSSDEKLRNASNVFLRTLFESMTDEEYTQSLLFFEHLHNDEGRSFSLNSRYELLDIIYDEFIHRITKNPTLFYLVEIFNISEYFNYTCGK